MQIGWLGPVNTWSLTIGRLICLDDELREKMGIGGPDWRLEPCAMMGYCSANGPHIHAWRMDYPPNADIKAHRVFEFKKLEE